MLVQELFLLQSLVLVHPRPLAVPSGEHPSILCLLQAAEVVVTLAVPRIVLRCPDAAEYVPVDELAMWTGRLGDGHLCQVVGVAVVQLLVAAAEQVRVVVQIPLVC